VTFDLRNLRDYQRPHTEKLVRALDRLSGCLDGSDCGTGKTYTGLAAMRSFDDGQPVLVIGPKAAHMGWEEASGIMGVPVTFVNYEKARYRGTGEDGGRKLVETEFLKETPVGKGSRLDWVVPNRRFIFDEVHRCGGVSTLNSKSVIAAVRANSKVLCLSATVATDPTQMKAVGFALRLHTLNGPNGFMSWMLRHGCKNGYFGGIEFTKNKTKQAAVMQRLNKAIYGEGRGARMRKADIPDFPKTQIDIKLLAADNEVAKLTEELHTVYEYRRQQEIAAEWRLEEVIRIRQKLEILKVPAVVDLAEDIVKENSVAIFVNYTDTLNAVLSALRQAGIHYGYVDGTQVGESGRIQRETFIKKFQRRELPVIVCNNAAGSESMSLHDATNRTNTTTLIFPSGSGRQMEQVIGRVHRDGGGFSDQYFVFFAKTYEEQIARRMQAARMNLAILNDADYEL